MRQSIFVWILERDGKETERDKKQEKETVLEMSSDMEFPVKKGTVFYEPINELDLL